MMNLVTLRLVNFFLFLKMRLYSRPRNADESSWMIYVSCTMLFHTCYFIVY